MLSDLQTRVQLLEADLHEQLANDNTLRDNLQAEWKKLKTKGRTAESFVIWSDAYLTQVAVAWVLTCVFVRYLEDNQLLRHPYISGLGKDYGRADDRRRAYFQKHPKESETDYLRWAFAQLAQAPAGDLFSDKRNIVHHVRISGDAARELVAFFRRIDPDTGELALKFQTEAGDTRFLGDLYQDLSEDARKRYALLQTPDFVEEFILDHTLEPAIETFGLEAVRMIDPTCGSGHFLLGAFKRLFEKRLRKRPADSRRQLVLEALEAVNGVDVNPFAVAISRFRLLIAALFVLKQDGKPRFDTAPALPLNIEVGDSLLHGKLFALAGEGEGSFAAQLDIDPQRYLAVTEHFNCENPGQINRILGRRYHAVVGNPPYITVKDKALGKTYRDHYQSCHRQYSLVCPFYERFVQLAVPKRSEHDAGYAGMIVSNAFMKREFGKKLVEYVMPKTDLNAVIDTSGAYIPGHGTPTVILFARNRLGLRNSIHAVLGIRGEPKTPKDPSRGLVWSSIADNFPGDEFENDFVTVSKVNSGLFSCHPWALRGGGALEAKVCLEKAQQKTLDDLVDVVGFGVVTREDDAYLRGLETIRRLKIPRQQQRPLVAGENVRDWGLSGATPAIWPYSPTSLQMEREVNSVRALWRYRTQLSIRVAYGLTQIERGLQWFEYSMFFRERFVTPHTMTFAFVATHNHFALDRGGKVFKRTAPVIKLPAEATEDDHLGLLGLLNSSTACFWMKMVFFNKGEGGGTRVAAGHSAMGSEDWKNHYEHDGTKIKQFPLPEGRPLELARRLDHLGARQAALSPSALAEADVPTADRLDAARAETEANFLQMVALQEELDWLCYGLYGLLDKPPLADDLDAVPLVNLGERPFEIVLARKMKEGIIETTWFERHGSVPNTDIPAHWPDWYRELVAQRIQLIEEKRFIKLIEQPEYKRRWSRAPWHEQEQAALREWLCSRLESSKYFPQADREGPGASVEPKVTPIRELAFRASDDTDFMQVAERYTQDATFDVAKLVSRLVLDEAVPYLPAQRYRKSGLRKHRAWGETWELQRLEDAIEDDPHLTTDAEVEKAKAEQVGDIPVPPKYASKDFTKPTYWKLRGKLDVPKERFILYQGAEPSDEVGPVVGWAGWDHAQRAQALASFYYEMKEVEGWEDQRLLPVLAGILDLVPWVKQWHNEPDEYGEPFGDFLEAFVAQEARIWGKSVEELDAIRMGG